MINHTLKRNNHQSILGACCLIGAVFLGFGCNETLNADSLHSESLIPPQTVETTDGVSDEQVVQSPVNEESQQNVHQLQVPQTEFGVPNDEDASNHQEESGEINQDESNHHGHLPVDGTDHSSETEDVNHIHQTPSDSDNEIADSKDNINEDSPSDGDTPHTHDWAQPIEAAGLPNLFKVSEDVYRSAQPESGGFESAENLGIKTILSVRLTANDAVLAENEPTSITLIHIPLAPIYITTDEMLEVMKAFDGAEKPILVHCLHGADRTGLTIALYRILYEHWSKEEAKDELVNGGFGYHTALSNILDFIDALDIDSFKSQLFGD